MREIEKERLMAKIRLAIEFRHKSWFESEDSMEIMKKKNTAIVFSHAKDFPYPKDEPITDDFVYLRLHGPKKLYGSEYGKNGLTSWAEKIKRW